MSVSLMDPAAEVERVEQSGRNAASSTFEVEPEALDHEWNTGTGELERRARTITTAPSLYDGLSSFNSPALALRARLQALFERFERAMRGEGFSDWTLRGRGQHLALFFRHLSESQSALASVSDITPEILLSYRDQLITRDKRGGKGLLSVGSVAGHVSTLKAFFAFLTQGSEILIDPAKVLKAPRLPRRLPRNVPSPSQMKRLLTIANKSERPLGARDTAILELLYGTGLRNAELCALSLSDYDAAQGIVFVRMGKGSKDRVIPVGQKAREALGRYLPERMQARDTTASAASNAHLFVTNVRAPITPDTVRQLLTRVLKRAGLFTKRRHVTPHTLRHACATHLLRGHADIRHIQVLLGHASLKTTEIYTRVDTTDLKRVLKRCHPREREP